MGNDHDLRQNMRQAGPSPGLGRVILAVKFGLDQFQIPVAELAPDKTVQALGRLVEAVALNLGRVLFFEHFQAVQDPAVMQAGHGRRIKLGLGAVDMHQGKTGRVPDFVDEMAVALDACFRQLDVPAHGRKGGQGETQGVAAVFVDHGQRVDDVARGLGHLLAVLVADQGMDIDVLEGHVVHELESHHHHPRDPEEKDVKTRDQERGRVKSLELVCLFRPAHGGKRPQGRREPRVEHVLVLNESSAAARTGRWVLTGDKNFAAVLTGPDRNAVSPPQLA